MKILIVEDDFTCRTALQSILSPYGEVHIAVNGNEAIDVLAAALEADSPYDLVCLDIMMPGMDGQDVLKSFRFAEEKKGIPLGRGAKIIMTTSLKDGKNVVGAFHEHCDAYLVKPIEKDDLLKHLHAFKLIAPDA